MYFQSQSPGLTPSDLRPEDLAPLPEELCCTDGGQVAGEEDLVPDSPWGSPAGSSPPGTFFQEARAYSPPWFKPNFLSSLPPVSSPTNSLGHEWSSCEDLVQQFADLSLQFRPISPAAGASGLASPQSEESMDWMSSEGDQRSL